MTPRSFRPFAGGYTPESGPTLPPPPVGARTGETGHARPFAPTGACSGCPFRGTCHEARQRIQDGRFALGRHYGCEFYEGIRQATRPAPPPGGWLRRLLQGRRG